MHRYLILYSKTSGRKTIRSRKKMLENFCVKNNIPHFVVELDHKSSKLEDVSFDLLQKKFQFTAVIIAGGDGMFRRTAEKLYLKKKDYPLFFLPIGSTNVLAKMLKLPPLIELLFQRLKNPKETMLSVGILNKKHLFFIACCFGKFAKISTKADQFNKKVIGFLAYLISFFYYGLSFRKKKYSIKINQGKYKNRQAHSVLVFTEKATRLMAKGNEKKDHFSIFSFRNRTVLGLLHSIFMIFTKKKKSETVVVQTAKKIDIQGDFGSGLHLDGDHVKVKNGNYQIDFGERKVRVLV